MKVFENSSCIPLIQKDNATLTNANHSEKTIELSAVNVIRKAPKDKTLEVPGVEHQYNETWLSFHFKS